VFLNDSRTLPLSFSSQEDSLRAALSKNLHHLSSEVHVHDEKNNLVRRVQQQFLPVHGHDNLLVVVLALEDNHQEVPGVHDNQLMVERLVDNHGKDLVEHLVCTHQEDLEAEDLSCLVRDGLVVVVVAADLGVVENNHLADNLEDVDGVPGEGNLEGVEAHDDNHQMGGGDMIRMEEEADHDNHVRGFGQVEVRACSLRSVGGKDHGRFHEFGGGNV